MLFRKLQSRFYGLLTTLRLSVSRNALVYVFPVLMVGGCTPTPRAFLFIYQ